jgi:hypothetical protein
MSVQCVTGAELRIEVILKDLKVPNKRYRIDEEAEHSSHIVLANPIPDVPNPHENHNSQS